MGRRRNDPAFAPSILVLLLAVVLAVKSGGGAVELGLVCAAACVAIALFWRPMDDKELEGRSSFSPSLSGFGSPAMKYEEEEEDSSGDTALISRLSGEFLPVSTRLNEASAPKSSLNVETRPEVDPPPRFPMLDIRNHLFDIAPPSYPETVYANSRTPIPFGNQCFEGHTLLLIRSVLALCPLLLLLISLTLPSIT